MEVKMLMLLVVVVCSAASVSCLPLQTYSSRQEVTASRAPLARSLWKRFIDTSSSVGGLHTLHSSRDSGKMRTRRSPEPRPQPEPQPESAEEAGEEAGERCERLRLCRLHARSSTSFLAAFELYFVNKENARLWDHRARSPRDCERRFSCDR